MKNKAAACGNRVDLITWGMSFRYLKNNKGTRMVPHMQYLKDINNSFLKLKSRFERHDLNQSKV